MAGFMDILGTIVQQGMSQSSGSRMSNGLGAGSSGGLGDLMGSLGKMMGGIHGSGQATQAGAGGLGDLGGMLGEVMGSLGKNKAALGGLGALTGALLGRGKSSARGAVGGGGLAMLASLAFSALQKAGKAPAQTPRAFLEPQTPKEEQVLEDDAEVIVKAMINAAKADGQIDEAEIQKIVGKLEKGGLTSEEKSFFVAEANKPMNLNKVVASAGGRAEMAAQIYVASLLAIEVDTTAEQAYMKALAAGLELHPQVADHIERTLGVTAQ